MALQTVTDAQRKQAEAQRSRYQASGGGGLNAPRPRSIFGSPQTPIAPFSGLFAGGSAFGGGSQQTLPGPNYPGGGGGGGGTGYPGGGPPGGMGGGGGGGGVPWVNIQTNPYQKEAFQQYRELMDKYEQLSKEAPDPTAALQNLRDTGAGIMSDIATQGAMRGLGGGSGITKTQQLNAGRELNEQAAELSADWRERALKMRADLLGAMTQGVAGGMSNLGLGMGQQGIGWYNALTGAQNDAQRNQIAWYQAINNAQWAPLQYIGGLIGALGGLV